MKVILFPNLLKRDAFDCTVSVCKILSEAGAQLLMDNYYSQSFGHIKSLIFGDFKKLSENADFAIAIGGDGTILKCVSGLADSDIKLLGINTGRLGFMASVEKDNLCQLERLFTGEYKISERMLITGEVDKKGNTISVHALNDIVVSSRYSKIIEFDVCVNDNLIGSYLADGVVFSTPTGSTAYALSTGGPIIEPEMECIEMNLICPHSLFTRPMIYKADSELTFVHRSTEDLRVGFSSDGNDAISLERGEKLTIKKSSRKVRLIDMTGITFYDSLNRKLMRTLKGI